MNCIACGDPLAEKPFKAPNGLPTKPKCHCNTCYLELVWGIIPRGYVHHTDTRTGGGQRVMRNEKAVQ